MSQALTIIDVPAIRPPGVTPRQWRLAALYPRAESARQAMLDAGYALQSADKNTSRTTGSVGVKLAREAIAALQADRAKGLMGYGTKALANPEFEQMAPGQRAIVGLKAVELAHQIGESIEQVGTASAWRVRLRRAMRLAYRFGFNAGRLAPTLPSQQQE